MDPDIFAVVIKFVCIRDVLTKIRWLNKQINQIVCSENYTLYKHFLQLFCLNRHKKRGSVPVGVDMVKLILDNVLIREETLEDYKECQLNAFAFFTDGGTYSDYFDYFIHQVFGNGTHLHSSGPLPDPSKNGVNIQAYVGRRAELTYTAPATFRVKPMDKMVMKIPIENYILNSDEQETYKQLTKVVVNKENVSYTCFCKCYMLFVSDKEVDCLKSPVLKAFAGVNSIQKFLDLGLPLLQYSQPNEEAMTDLSGLKDLGEKSVAIEINLQRMKMIEKVLKIKRMDCYPVFWCQQPAISIKWSFAPRQRIAFKYCTVKLIDRHSSTAPDPNVDGIDMFALNLFGIKLKIPADQTDHHYEAINKSCQENYNDQNVGGIS